MNLSEAAKVIYEAYTTDKTFREAVIASVESALRETTVAREYEDLAEKIAGRVFGDER